MGASGLLLWALTRALITLVQVEQLLARAQHLCMHMGQSSHSKQQTPEDPRDLHPGENGAPDCNALVFQMSDGQKACVYPM